MLQRTTSAEPDYTVKQFAAITNQSTQHVYRLIRAGVIPSYRIGNAVRIRREDVDAIRQPQPKRLNPALAAEVKRAVDSWPPLTPEQRDAVAAIFNAPNDVGGGEQ